MSFDLKRIIRKNILALQPYSSARDDFSGEASVFLDANENSLGSPLAVNYNRYPDPHQRALKALISPIKKVPADQIFLGNGSDECIDLLYRSFCRPGVDNTIICPPTYGMYEVSAEINDVAVRSIPLRSNFQLDVPAVEKAIDENSRLIWICSPNNPTGNLMHKEDIIYLLSLFKGLVVVDEAYIDFAGSTSLTGLLDQYPNLVVLQTFSKAWGLAGLRLGMAFASREIIALLSNVKAPYNINIATQKLAMQALENVSVVDHFVEELDAMRRSLAETLAQLPIVEKVYPSDANFLLVKVKNAPEVYEGLLSRGVVVRDRHTVVLCADCLRITVGNLKENEMLIEELHDLYS